MKATLMLALFAILLPNLQAQTIDNHAIQDVDSINQIRADFLKQKLEPRELYTYLDSLENQIGGKLFILEHLSYAYRIRITNEMTFPVFHFVSRKLDDSYIELIESNVLGGINETQISKYIDLLFQFYAKDATTGEATARMKKLVERVNAVDIYIDYKILFSKYTDLRIRRSTK